MRMEVVHVGPVEAGLDDGDGGVSRTAMMRAIFHAGSMLASLGIPCDEEGTQGTPERYVRALMELTAGIWKDPDQHLSRTFSAPSDNPGMVIVPGVAFVSVCEHHLMPFVGSAAVAYIPSPGAPVVGLSKLARLVQEYAARPQMQERLGDQIVEAITGSLETEGAACVIRARHSCMTMRGARATEAEMVTSHLRGAFRLDRAVRDEFLDLLRNP